MDYAAKAVADVAMRQDIGAMPRTQKEEDVLPREA
jgi:hypothetical protein